MGIPSFLSQGAVPLRSQPPAGGPALPVPKLLRVAVAKQDQTNWCWAAVSVGVAEAYGTVGKSQCGLASTFIAPHCCPPLRAACDHPFGLELPLAPHHAASVPEHDQRTFQFVKDEIDQGRPIAVRIDRNHGGSGHAVVIGGYLVDASGISGHFYICDPQWGDRAPWRFEHFRDSFEQDGVWDISYKTTGPGPVPDE